MSWLPNPFKSPQLDAVSNPSHVAGVRDDLSVLSQTIGRQLRGVAAFLAPPPSPPSSRSPVAAASDSSSSASSSPTLRGIRNDLAEIGGSFKSGLKTFSNLFQSQRGDADDACLEDYDGVAGITEEVLHFVTQLSTRPECWTDFPSVVDDDFFMSDIQREHASTIERLAPSFADLRLKLCNYMSDGQFWMIYFILLLPRLNEHDSKLLSTPKIVQVRDVLLLKLQNKRDGKVNSENSMVDLSEGSSKVSRTLGEDSPSQEKEVLSESVSGAHEMDKGEQENTEQCLEEEDADTGNSAGAVKRLENEDDVSFSDLEDGDNDLSQRLSGFRLKHDNRVSSPDGSNEWVKLKESCETQGQQRTGQCTSQERDSEGEESNDWLTVDFDSDSLGAV